MAKRNKEEQELYITFNNGSRFIKMKVFMELPEGYILVDGGLVPKENVVKKEIK